MNKKVYDIIGIGIGPFNLGLAALTESIQGLDCLFFDQSPGFDWHAGMMLPNARLQVPFYADLVTVVDPCNRFSFLNYLKEKQRLFRFAIHENNFITRKEYNSYCQWVVDHLPNLHFHHKVVDVHYERNEEVYTVMLHHLTEDKLVFYQCKHLVLGIGSSGRVPECVVDLKAALAVHSGDYLLHKDSLLEQSSITIVGGGQSAAEIFHDLLSYTDHLESLCWFTRSERFYPMEYSKLSLELTSPDYIDHFFRLSPDTKKEVLKKQTKLYRGINFSLINEIYDALYDSQFESSGCSVHLQCNTELQAVAANGDGLDLQFYHKELGLSFSHGTGGLILATGYVPRVPQFLEPVREYIRWMDNGLFDVHRNYSVDVSGKRIFVQNAELHSHGFSAPDLGMGPYRNASIINTILGYEYFVLEKSVAFQCFGMPEKDT